MKGIQHEAVGVMALARARCSAGVRIRAYDCNRPVTVCRHHKAGQDHGRLERELVGNPCAHGKPRTRTCVAALA
mgnify:CR=1 FL=1